MRDSNDTGSGKSEPWVSGCRPCFSSEARSGFLEFTAKTDISFACCLTDCRDVRLLIVSIVFVGIFAFISETIFRSIQFGGVGRSKKGGGVMILVALALALVGYLIASLLRFSLSRNREYLADAGAAELTRRPKALASALRKVAADPTIEAVKRRDVAQLFLDNPKTRKAKRSVSFTSLFATHPPIDRRIELLEQY